MESFLAIWNLDTLSVGYHEGGKYRKVYITFTQLQSVLKRLGYILDVKGRWLMIDVPHLKGTQSEPVYMHADTWINENIVGDDNVLKTILEAHLKQSETSYS